MQPKMLINFYYILIWCIIMPSPSGRGIIIHNPYGAIVKPTVRMLNLKAILARWRQNFHFSGVEPFPELSRENFFPWVFQVFQSLYQPWSIPSPNCPPQSRKRKFWEFAIFDRIWSTFPAIGQRIKQVLYMFEMTKILEGKLLVHFKLINW